MVEYRIGDLVFKTKKEAETHTRKYIKALANGRSCCEFEEGTGAFASFKDLLKNHSDYKEKKGCGIQQFIIKKNKQNKNSYHMTLKRKDNTEVSFSWLHCCKFLEEDLNKDNYNLSQAFRNAIYYQICNFRKSATKECVFCGVDDEDTIYHVDHIIPFSKIKDDFLDEYVKPIPNTFDKDLDGIVTFTDDDYEFNKIWTKYHLENAELQILCQTCNLKKSNK
jgi:5-methylcytosine-specific restriction endonuclease McrA